MLNPASFVLALGLLALAGCGPDLPTADDLRPQFEQEQAAFDELRQMGAEDAPAGGYFAIGPDHLAVGDEVGGGLGSGFRHDGPLSYEVAEGETGMDPERFERYLALLKRVGSDRLTVLNFERGAQTRLSMGSAGIAVSGCTVAVQHATELPSHVRELQTVTPLGGGWYVDEECT